jgi:biotin carboxyl carrier protein
MTDQDSAPPGSIPLQSPGTQYLVPDPVQAIVPAIAATAGQRAEPGRRRPWFKKKRVALPSAVLLVFLLIMLSTGGNDPRVFDFTSTPLQSRTEGPVSPPATATVGQSVRDGQLSFIVTAMQQPTKVFADRLGTLQTAQGEFILVRLSVTNIGYEPRTVTATDQFLISNQGQRFATSAAISSVQGSEKVLLQKINPGNTVYDVPLLFDVAAGSTIASIELHDTISSAGVKVKLP